MKAAILSKSNTIECTSFPEPDIGEYEILVEVAYCGICGSDIPRVFGGASKMYPNILGHEFSGKVVAVGKKADYALLNQRVAGIPLVPCMSCDACNAGDYSLCDNYSFIGSRQYGAFAEYVVVPMANVLPISQEVTMLQASFFEPASVAVHAVNRINITLGTSAAVFGCGTIGIMIGQILKAAGVQTIAMLGRREKRLKAVLACDLGKVFDTDTEYWSEEAIVYSGGRGFDLVFDATGNSISMPLSFSLAGNKGSVCFVGTPKSDISFTVAEWEQINRKELSVTGSWMSYSAPFPGSEWTKAAQLFESGELFIVPEMIDAVYSLDDIDRAFARYLDPSKVNGKILIQCGSES